MDNKCKCGNDRFYASQRITVDVIVDSEGNFVDNLTGNIGNCIIDACNPHGTMVCTKCNKVFKELD